MTWLTYVSYVFGGLFFGNAIPHYVSGTMGHAFQSPFACPRGKGLSSALVNIAWGAFNIVIAYVLVFRVGRFDLRNASSAIAFGAGFISIGSYRLVSLGHSMAAI